jgi:hypothetical protein
MCNGTVALEITIRALGMSGEVIVPSLTFVATAHALQWQAITPVFCDISPESLTIDARRIEELITPRTTGIIGVHLFGRPCDVQSLMEIAHRRRLLLMFDASHAFGCSYNGRMIGGFGEAEVFSFHEVPSEGVQIGERRCILSGNVSTHRAEPRSERGGHRHGEAEHRTGCRVKPNMGAPGDGPAKPNA